MIRFGSAQRNCNSGDPDGAVLVSVLGVIVFLMIMFLGAMTFCLSRYGQHVKAQNRVGAGFLAEAGVQHALSSLVDSSQLYDAHAMSAPNGGTYDTRTIAWGPFLMVLSDGKLANQKVRATALIGSGPSELIDAAVTVCNTVYPFIVAGNTQIVGDVNTGPLGMTTGRIEGEGVVGENYYVGRNNMSSSLHVPELDTAILSRYYRESADRKLKAQAAYQGSQLWTGDLGKILNVCTAVTVENNLRLDKVTHNSQGSVVSVFVEGSVEITGTSRIVGPLEIIAQGSIRVVDSSALDNVLLFARDSVAVAGSASITGIAMSPRRVVVTENAQLLHPSLILVDAPANSCEDSCGIWLMSQQPCEGVCYLNCDGSVDARDNYRIYLDTSAVFTGALISQGTSDLRGTVHGTVITHSFTYTRPTTTYVNWVKDFHIDRTKLDYIPTLPLLTESRTSSEFRIARQDMAP